MNINPEHYKGRIECIVIAEWLGFNLGSAFKYLYRFKNKNGTEGLNKAIWYLKNEIKFYIVNKKMSVVEFSPSEYTTAFNAINKIGLDLPERIAEEMINIIKYTKLGIPILMASIKEIEAYLNEIQ